mgnify:CR=1 FL=1
MCGFAGCWGAQGKDKGLNLAAQTMASAIAHRGPDDAGVWSDDVAGLAMAHQRLSVLDLSAAGHQPMLSTSGRYVIAFNGEIYNHLDLRKGLASCVWRGHSDTETLLAAIEAGGVEATLKQCIGMFAFALWDRHARTLTLARDRFGEKPLYYGRQGDVFLFGSELKALKAHPAFHAEIDRDALALYLRHGYIPAPHSIYKGIFKLPPGTWAQVSAGLEMGEPIVYWSARQAAERGQRNLFKGGEAEAVQELERLLQQSITGQMMADVPLGAFLSGGVDSSAVVALMQAQSSRPVKTFTIGFKDQGYNEAEYARAVAQHLETEHTELSVSPEQAMAVIPQLPHIYDEPFADSSQIPTWLISQMAREQVTVSLSGDGGDELFGGYNRYFLGQKIRKIGRLPLPLRGSVAAMIAGISPERLNSVMGWILPLLPGKLRFANPGDKLHKLAGVLHSESMESLYLGLVSLWDDPTSIVLGSKEPTTVLTDRSQWPDLPDLVQQMMALDTVSYLPDDILTKVDRAGMNVSLETRVPFLDHRVMEFAWHLPLSLKIHNGQGKYVLRQVLYKRVPKELIERPKMGFGIPLDSWLRGPLRDWAESLLDETKIKREGFFDPVPIRKKWVEHLSGRCNWQHQLWVILMFQSWLEFTNNESK